MLSDARRAAVNTRLLVILGVILVLFVGGLAGAYKFRKRVTANQALAAGQAALARSQWPEAVRQLKQYLSRYPDDPETLVQFAQANLRVRPLRRENFGGAMQAYRKYLRLRPDDHEIMDELGKLYISHGEFNEAAYIYNQSLQHSIAAGQPRKPKSCLGLAQALVLQRKYEEAVVGENAPLRVLLTQYPRESEGYVLFRAVLDRDASPKVRNAARDVLAHLGEEPESLPRDTQPNVNLLLVDRLLDAGLRHNPESALLLVQRARFRRVAFRGQPDILAACKQDLEAADRARPANPEVLFQLFDEWYESAYAGVAPDHLNRAAAELEAIAKLDEATLAEYRRKPEDMVFSVLLGQAKLAFKRDGAARRFELAERWKDLPEEDQRRYLPFAARLYLLAGHVKRAEEAAAAYKLAVRNMPGVNQAVRDSVTLLDASLAVARGEWYDVINLVEPLVMVGRIDGGPEAPGLLMAAYAATGQHQRLIHQFEAHRNLWLDDAGVLRPVVSAYMALGRETEARNYAILLERIDLDSVAPRLLRIWAEGRRAARDSKPPDAQRLSKLIEETAALRAELDRERPEGEPRRSMDVRLLEAELMLLAGRGDEAVAFLERSAAECERPLAARMKAIEYLRAMAVKGELEGHPEAAAGYRDRAVASCRAAIEKFPEAAGPRIHLSELLLGDEASAVLDEAIDYFEELLDAAGRANNPARLMALREEHKTVARAWLTHHLARSRRAFAEAARARAAGDEAGARALTVEAENFRVRAVQAADDPDVAELLDVDAWLELLRAPGLLGDPGEAGRPEISREYLDKARAYVDRIEAIEGEQGLQWRMARAQINMRELDLLRAGPDAFARAHEEHRLRDAIVADLRYCISADPVWVAPALLLGNMYEVLGMAPQAEELYRGWLHGRPGNPTITNRLLALLQRQGRASEMTDLLKSLPESDQAKILRERYAATVALETRNYDQAIAALEKTIEETPNDLPAYVLLAALHQTHRNDARRALELLDQALRRDADFFDAFAAKIAILNAQDKNEQALQLLNEQMARSKRPELYKLRADLYLILGRDDQTMLTRAEQDLISMAALEDSGGQGHGLLGAYYEAIGDADRAIDVWREGLNTHPDNLELARKLALALAGRRDEASRERARVLLHGLDDGATDETDGLLERHPNDSDLLLAEAVYWQGESAADAADQARSALEGAVRANPRNVRAQTALIEFVQGPGDRRRDPRQARDLLQAALNANPRSYELLLLKGEFEAKTGNHDAALRAADAVAETAPRDLDAQNAAARLAFQTGSIEKAAQYNQAALKLDANDETAIVLRARILNDRGERAEAIRRMEEFRSKDAGRNSLPALLALADFYLADGRFDESDARIRQAESLAPRRLEVINARLAWLAEQERYADVGAFVNENLGKDAADTSILLAGASVLASANQIEAAIELYKQLLERDAADPHALNNLAWLLAMHQNRPEEGLEYANQGLRIYPNDPHLLDTRGAILFQLGRYADARADLEKCVLLIEPPPGTRCSALRTLARVYKTMNESALARNSLLEARRLDERFRLMTDTQRTELEQLLASLEGRF